MKRTIVTLCLLGLLANSSYGQDKKADPKPSASKPVKKTDPVFKTTKDKVSYGLGLNIARSLQRDGLEVNVELLVKGLKDVFNKAEPKLTTEEIREAMLAYQADLRANQAAKRKADADKNKKEGRHFWPRTKK